MESARLRFIPTAVGKKESLMEWSQDPMISSSMAPSPECVDNLVDAMNLDSGDFLDFLNYICDGKYICYDPSRYLDSMDLDYSAQKPRQGGQHQPCLGFLGRIVKNH